MSTPKTSYRVSHRAPTRNMRSLCGLPVTLLLCVLPNLVSAGRLPTPTLKCFALTEDHAGCDQPLEPLTTITPGSLYFAKLACLDCPVAKATRGGERPHEIIQQENFLFFNVSLSHDRAALLLNGRSMFPAGETNGMWVKQLSSNYTRKKLDQLICSTFPPCEFLDGAYPPFEWDTAISPDYEYRATQLDDGELATSKWRITFDAIGGRDGYKGDPVWTFNRTEQQMLEIVISGTEMDQDNFMPDLQAGSGLFEPVADAPERVYELQIVDVKLVEPRSYTFPNPPAHTVWWKVKHFFGADTDTSDHIVYRYEEWAAHGKKGTLKNAVGTILFDWHWDLVAIIVGSTAAALVVAYIMYRLGLLVLEQRRLANWGGMDEVWRQIRETPDDGDEEDRLLDSGYRDYPDESSSSRPPRYTDDGYTDDVPVNKPLPSKPLPEKPLPPVPLIEEI